MANGTINPPAAQNDGAMSQPPTSFILKLLLLVYDKGGMPLVLVFGGLAVALTLITATHLTLSTPVVVTLAAGAILFVLFGAGVSLGQIKNLAQHTTILHGGWWEWIKPETGGAALSFIDVTPNAVTGLLNLSGTVFNRSGQEIAHWDSVNTGFDAGGNKLLYCWTGQGIDDPREQYGYGDYTFNFAQPEHPLAHGKYVDITRVGPDGRFTLKSVELARASEGDLAIMQANDPAAKTHCVLSHLGPLPVATPRTTGSAVATPTSGPSTTATPSPKATPPQSTPPLAKV